jgi:hypothetical protein
MAGIPSGLPIPRRIPAMFSAWSRLHLSGGVRVAAFFPSQASLSNTDDGCRRAVCVAQGWACMNFCFERVMKNT